MAGLVWRTPPQVAWPQLAGAYVAAIQRGIYAIAQKWAPILENEMKRSAPWTDRTGNARQGLHVEINQVVGSMVELILAHGVEYGLWLEVRHAGAYAVINPTIDLYAPQIWADVVRMLS